MKSAFIRSIICLTVAISISLSVGCSVENTVPDGVVNTGKNSEVVPTSKVSDFSYKGVCSKEEKTVATVKSSDGLAVINKKESYYEVILDLEKGSHYDVGKAYGEAILQIYPNFVEIAELCLYMNLGSLMNRGESANILKDRVDAVIPQIPKDYVDEINGLVDAFASSQAPFQADGKLSRYEIFALNLLPDIVRGTQCSGMVVLGDKSKTGSAITGRILEWFLEVKNICF